MQPPSEMAAPDSGTTERGRQKERSKPGDVPLITSRDRRGTQASGVDHSAGQEAMSGKEAWQLTGYVLRQVMDRRQLSPLFPSSPNDFLSSLSPTANPRSFLL